MEQKILNLIQKLQKIANKNGDEFECYIETEVHRGGKIYFTFVCEESADGHCFVGGSGYTFEEMVNRVEENLPDACDSWGYEQ